MLKWYGIASFRGGSALFPMRLRDVAIDSGERANVTSEGQVYDHQNPSVFDFCPDVRPVYRYRRIVSL